MFVVEHDLELMRRAQWLVDVGPQAGEHGGRVLYSGQPDGLRNVQDSRTAQYLFDQVPAPASRQRSAISWLELKGIHRHNLQGVDAQVPLGLLTAVTGISGSGKSSLMAQALPELMLLHLGHETVDDSADSAPTDGPTVIEATRGQLAGDVDAIQRVVLVDQKPIGRTPRSNLATYTGLFDHVRKLFAATPDARRRRFNAGRFSFNVAKGRCETCEGEGFVSVELLFMPSVYAPCPTCHGARYNEATLRVQWNGRNIAEVLQMTVDQAHAFFAGEEAIARPLQLLQEIGLGYLRLGQPATELSGGEAQRIKLATELQRSRAAHAVRAGRTHHRAACSRRGQAAGAASAAGGRRQHGSDDRARHAFCRTGRLGDRRRPGRRRCGRHHRGGWDAASGGPRQGQQDGTVPARAAPL